jgi:hypothetical protein
MSMFRMLVLLCAIAFASSVAFAGSIAVVNPDFSAVPILCGAGYAYQTFGGDCSSPVPQQDFNGSSGFGWTWIPNVLQNGLTAPNTAFNPPSFLGLPFNQAAFFQGQNATLSQTIGGFSAFGTYTLSFYLGSRYANGSFGYDGNQTVEALIDGNVIGIWALTSFTPFTPESAVFTVTTGGGHTLEFLGLNSGDHTAFLSDVAINGTVPEPASVGLFATGLLGLAGLRRRYF